MHDNLTSFSQFLVVGVALLVVGCASPPSSNRGNELGEHEKSLSRQCRVLRDFFFDELALYQKSVDETPAPFQQELSQIDGTSKKADLPELIRRFESQQQARYRADVLARIREMEALTQSLPPDNCSYITKLKRVRQIFEADILTDSDLIRMESENQRKTLVLVEKSSSFSLGLPGQKEPVSKYIYLGRLANLADRRQRELLYKYFNASRAAKWLHWEFMELVRSRNEEGRRAGFANYYEYRFFREGLDLNGYRTLLTEIKAGFVPALRRLIVRWGKENGIPNVEPWDVPYLSAQILKHERDSATRDDPHAIGRLGLKDLDVTVRQSSNLEGASSGPMASPVVSHSYWEDRLRIDAESRQSRTIATLSFPASKPTMRMVMHAMAHKIYTAEIQQPLAPLRAADFVVTEAFAILLERLTTPTRLEQALTLFQHAVYSDFEYEMYRNPEQSLGELWAKLYQEYWGIPMAPFFAGWDIDLHLSHPVRGQSYVLAQLMAEQLLESARLEFGEGILSPAFGEKLRSLYFRPGREFNYLELTSRFTGKPLSASSVMALLNGTQK